MSRSYPAMYVWVPAGSDLDQARRYVQARLAERGHAPNSTWRAFTGDDALTTVDEQRAGNDTPMVVAFFDQLRAQLVAKGGWLMVAIADNEELT